MPPSGASSSPGWPLIPILYHKEQFKRISELYDKARKFCRSDDYNLGWRERKANALCGIVVTNHDNYILVIMDNTASNFVGWVEDECPIEATHTLMEMFKGFGLAELMVYILVHNVRDRRETSTIRNVEEGRMMQTKNAALIVTSCDLMWQKFA